MKRALYIALMMILFNFASFGLYLSTLYCLVFYKIIDRYHVVNVTLAATTPTVYMFVSLVGIICGYFFGKRWWKIVYIDKVYYFDESLRKK